LDLFEFGGEARVLERTAVVHGVEAEHTHRVRHHEGGLGCHDRHLILGLESHLHQLYRNDHHHQLDHFLERERAAFLNRSAHHLVGQVVYHLALGVLSVLPAHVEFDSAHVELLFDAGGLASERPDVAALVAAARIEFPFNQVRWKQFLESAGAPAFFAACILGG